jgi:hypothetical protein
LTGAQDVEPVPTPHPPVPTATDAAQFAGWLDHVSLTLTVQCDRDELMSALREQHMHAPLSDLVRTYVHELAHTGQALGSTLGYYTWMLRSVQHDYVVRMLKWLVNDVSLPIKTPLIRYLRTVGAAPGQADETGDANDAKVTGLVHGWQIAEVMIAEIAGTPQGFLHSAVQMPVEGTTWPQRWSRMQANIAELYESPDRRWPDEFFLALYGEPVTPVPDQYVAMLTVVPTMFVFTPPAVMESAALAVELSPTDEPGLREVLNGSERRSGAERIELYDLLDRTAKAYPGLPAERLLATHLAACDVALNPPCLPIHLLDRKALDLKELHPVGRVVEIWQRLGDDIEPARNIDDALRCSDDICAALDWTSVSAVLARGAENYGDTGSDPRGRAFATAMKGRLNYPPLLHNPWVPIWSTGALANAYRAELVPAFWAFDDDWLPGSDDNERTDRFIFTTLLFQWTRSMMVGRPDPLRLPVPMPAEIRDRFARLLAQGLSEMVGKSLRPPVVANPPSP